MSVLRSAASMAARSASTSAVVAASVGTRAAPDAVCTHHASAVRRIETVITGPTFILSVGYGSGVGDVEQPAQGGQVEFVVVTQCVDHRGKFSRGRAR